ncbi:hypothetical protein [Erythrobacter litoralis]|uniref:hypothetical protein n=1 Tax=Erythrobacter litoralis TaxID=39960 RepID=UPI002434AD08|nr:hypothetical protein [Erythrobacter litoralis]
MIEIEIQNETHQSQFRIKALSVPRIGEGLRLMEPSGAWASYDVLDVWYQQAEFGEVWVPYLHVRITAGQAEAPAGDAETRDSVPNQAMPIEEFLKRFEGTKEHEPVKLTLDMSED